MRPLSWGGGTNGKDPKFELSSEIDFRIIFTGFYGG